MIRKKAFFLSALLGMKAEGVKHGEERQTDGLDDASTDFVQQCFLWPERGKLEYFLLFELEREEG